VFRDTHPDKTFGYIGLDDSFQGVAGVMTELTAVATVDGDFFYVGCFSHVKNYAGIQENAMLDGIAHWSPTR
jgi:hypothetical protein